MVATPEEVEQRYEQIEMKLEKVEGTDAQKALEECRAIVEQSKVALP